MMAAYCLRERLPRWKRRAGSRARSCWCRRQPDRPRAARARPPRRPLRSCRRRQFQPAAILSLRRRWPSVSRAARRGCRRQCAPDPRSLAGRDRGLARGNLRGGSEAHPRRPRLRRRSRPRPALRCGGGVHLYTLTPPPRHSRRSPRSSAPRRCCSPTNRATIPSTRPAAGPGASCAGASPTRPIPLRLPIRHRRTARRGGCQPRARDGRRRGARRLPDAARRDCRRAAAAAAGPLRADAAGGLRADPGAGRRHPRLPRRPGRPRRGGGHCRRHRRSADRHGHGRRDGLGGVLFARLLTRFVSAGQRIGKVAGTTIARPASSSAPESKQKERPPLGSGLSIVGSAVRFRPPAPFAVTHQSRQRPRSRSRQPGTVGYDNETLDHLLSFVDGKPPIWWRSRHAKGRRRCGVLPWLRFPNRTLRAMTDLPAPVGRRRTFAIISHPDAGKTTLTEKLLLFGGAIQLAGEVKAKRTASRPAPTGWASRRSAASRSSPR